MSKQYTIEIETKRVRYKFTIENKVNIIKADISEDNNTLIELVKIHEAYDDTYGMKLSCELSCKVLYGRNWKNKLKSTNNSIVFIDDSEKFIESEIFAQLVEESTNYFIIISSRRLSKLQNKIRYTMKSKEIDHKIIEYTLSKE